MSHQLTIHRDNQEIYDIVIEKDWSKFADRINLLSWNKRKICIVTDTNVAKYHLNAVSDILANQCGCEVHHFVFQAGEAYKTLDTVRSLYESLILNHFERKDALVALGGGVVGDLTGYTAATYLRGIDFIQVPTTLLSQVDSSIGGKTGVDFDAYKNMVGAFHMPKLVYMNMATLNTLDEKTYLSGYGEIIKHAYIKNASYLENLLSHKEDILSRNLEYLEDVIYESCKIKGQVVEIDPTEKGERMLLNFGHTLGHAIEKLSNFTMYHGECVVLGMICALQISLSRNMISQVDYNTAIQLFRDLKFPTVIRDYDAEAIIMTSRSDKKMEAGKIRFVLLKHVGEAYVDYTVTEEEMRLSLKSVIESL